MLKENTITKADYDAGKRLNQYRTIRDWTFHWDTTYEVAKLLCLYRQSKSEVRIFLGDKTTGLDWNEENDTTGRIGRSTGTMKIPLLIPKNDIGGPALSDDSIVKIVNVRTKEVLWQHPTYHCRKFGIFAVSPTDRVRSKVCRKENEQWVEVATFNSTDEAEHYVAYMEGREMKPFNPKIRSKQCATRFATALIQYQKLIGHGESLLEDEELEDVLTDLMSDLHHFIASTGNPSIFEAIMRRGLIHYEQEMNGQD